MYIMNRYLCECGLLENVKGKEPREPHICSECGSQSKWLWAGEYDDNNCRIRQYGYNGEIIEEGSHDELIAQGGKYYQLYTGTFEMT